MRSTTPSPRRLRSRPPRHGPLEAIARVVDLAGVDQRGHLLVHVLGAPGDDVELGIGPFDTATHPFWQVAGLTAPDHWWAFGVRARGQARFLDEPDRPPERLATTFLVSRTGEEVSLLRSGEAVSVVPGPAAGTIPDACRRVLGLPTPPAPPTTAVLWTTVWLDRLMQAWGDPLPRRGATSSWPALARLHPAVAQRGDASADDVTDGAALVPLARAHAATWSWRRLRAEPHALGSPVGELPVHVAAWMDDGSYARWVLGAYPSITTLAIELRGLLGDPLGEELLATVVASLE